MSTIKTLNIAYILYMNAVNHALSIRGRLLGFPVYCWSK